MYTLYWSPNSAALAPQICLEEAGAEYETRRVPINEVPEKDPGYLKLNPAGKVPTLVLGDGSGDGAVIYEAAAICLYLADRHKDAKLMPAGGDPALGTALQWLVFRTNTLQPSSLRFYYPELHTAKGGDTGPLVECALAEIATLWGRIDAHLAGRGPFFLGARFCAADAFAYMLSNWQESCPGLADRFPNVARLADAVRARPSVQRILGENELAA